MIGSNILRDTASRIFSDHMTSQLLESVQAGVWPAQLWDVVEEAGLHMALMVDETGRTELPLSEGLSALREIGRHAAPIPLAETTLAGWLLSLAGIALPPGPVAIAPVCRAGMVRLDEKDGWRLTADLRRIPWARDCKHIAVVCESAGRIRVALLGLDSATITPGSNFAGEPRDRVVFDDVPIGEGMLAAAPDDFDFQTFWFRAALVRLVQMEGALDQVLKMVVQYVQERVQFGRPIGKFQAVQQQLAVLAGNVAATNAAASAAVAAAERNDRAFFEIAAAKARIGEAATIVTSLAHQLYGAAGFSREFPLHYFTKRLWDWRDEFGEEAELWDWLGQTAAAGGGSQLWHLVSAEGAELYSPREGLQPA